MENKELRQHINEVVTNSYLFDYPFFDNSIIGITAAGNIVYDYDRMAEEFVQDEIESSIDFRNLSDDEQYSEAYEWIDYNTIRTIPYMNDAAKPIIIMENHDDEYEYFDACDMDITYHLDELIDEWIANKEDYNIANNGN